MTICQWISNKIDAKRRRSYIKSKAERDINLLARCSDALIISHELRKFAINICRIDINNFTGASEYLLKYNAEIEKIHGILGESVPSKIYRNKYSWLYCLVLRRSWIKYMTEHGPNDCTLLHALKNDKL